MAKKKFRDIVANSRNSAKGFKSLVNDNLGLSLEYPIQEIDSIDQVTVTNSDGNVINQSLTDILRNRRFANKDGVVEWYCAVRVKVDEIKKDDEVFGITYTGSIKSLTNSVLGNADAWKLFEDEFYSDDTLIQIVNRQIRANNDEKEFNKDTVALNYWELANEINSPSKYKEVTVRLDKDILDTKRVMELSTFGRSMYDRFVMDGGSYFFIKNPELKTVDSLTVTDNGCSLKEIPSFLISVMQDAAEQNRLVVTHELNSYISKRNDKDSKYESLVDCLDSLVRQGVIDKAFADNYKIVIVYSYTRKADEDNEEGRYILEPESAKVSLSGTGKDGIIESGLFTCPNRMIKKITQYKTFIRDEKVMQFTNNPNTYNFTLCTLPDVPPYDGDEFGLRSTCEALFKRHCPYTYGELQSKFSDELRHHFWRLIFSFGAAMDAANHGQFYTALVGPGDTGKSFIVENILTNVIQQRIVSVNNDTLVDANNYVRDGLHKRRVIYCDEYDGECLNGNAGKRLVSGGTQTVKVLYDSSIEFDPSQCKIWVTSNGTTSDSKVKLPEWQNQRRCLPIVVSRKKDPNKKKTPEVEQKLKDEAEGLRKVCWFFYSNTKLKDKAGEYFVGSQESEATLLNGESVDRMKAYVDEISNSDVCSNYLAVYDNSSSERTEAIQDCLNAIVSFTGEKEDMLTSSLLCSRIDMYIGKQKESKDQHEHPVLNPGNRSAMSFTHPNYIPFKIEMERMGASYIKLTKGENKGKRRWVGVKLK